MGLGGVVGKVRKVLGVLTDLLLVGRKAGWWNKNNQIPTTKKK